MDNKEIDNISQKAKELKEAANSNTLNFNVFLDAEAAYNQAYALCYSATDIEPTTKDILCALYKYEALDCRYAYEIKKKSYEKSRNTNYKQKLIVDGILNKYNLENLPSEKVIKWYKYLENFRISLIMKANQPIAKKLMDEGKYEAALYYFRSAEYALSLIDISSLNDEFLLAYKKNFHIIRFNISQCQIGIYINEGKKDELLNKIVIESLLFGISETKNLISLGGPDSTYENAITQMREWIVELLAPTQTSWDTLLDSNQKENQTLAELMQAKDSTKYSIAVNSLTGIQKENRFLLYSHGFNTRGKWKEVFTEEITAKMGSSNISFTMRPWDYGLFIIRFILPWARRRVIRDFCSEYRRINDRYGPGLKKCLVAHSFATYISGIALIENTDIKFERIIYLGNILDINFDWEKLKTNNQIEKVFYEKSTNDAAIAAGEVYRKVIPWVKWIGCAGKRGFAKEYPFVTYRESESGHSDMITEENIKGVWFEFLVS